MTAGETVARLVREEGPRVLATLVRFTGSIDLAEDAAQDAVVRALETRPRDGVPDNPRGWLLVAAKRRAIDVVRREARRTGKELAASLDPDPEPGDTDLLRLIFTCCHPALTMEAQVALALRTLGGLSTAEVARAMMVPEATMAKRLTRAKQKIAQARIPYRVPTAGELPDRLTGVAATVYLIFNEGYAAVALVALLLLQDSRRDARLDAEGRPVLLADQDRNRWDPAAIKEGVELVGRGLRRTPEIPDRYVVQAAIAACHAIAPSYADTDWKAIVSWYDVLLTVHDIPVVRLNRAAAVAERDGAAAGLALVDAIDGAAYAWWHATRAELLHRLGLADAARAAYQEALAAGMNEPLADQLGRRLGSA